MPTCRYYLFDTRFTDTMAHDFKNDFEIFFFEVYKFWQLLIIKSVSSGSLTPLSPWNASRLFFALILTLRRSLSLSLSRLPFINPTKLLISVPSHSEASKKTCTVVLLLSKIHTFCLHSPTPHTETPPFTPAHTLCPTASQGWGGLACKCFPGDSCRLRVLRPGDGSRWRLARNQYFFFCLLSSYPSPFLSSGSDRNGGWQLTSP